MKRIDPASFGDSIKKHCLSLTSMDAYIDGYITRVMPELGLDPGGQGGGVLEPMFKDFGRLLDIAALGSDSITASAEKPPVIVALCGETHRNIDDADRARALVKRMLGQEHLSSILIVEERGLSHFAKQPNLPRINQAMMKVNYANEMLFQDPDSGFHERQRSYGVAAYIFSCLAAGPLKGRQRVLVLFGENHIEDIALCLELLVRKTGITELRAKPRAYYMMKTLAKVD